MQLKIPEGNKVELKGKITKLGRVKYLPSGLAILEGTLAIVQTLFEKKGVGYVDFILSGQVAENEGRSLRIGQPVSFSGGLVCRRYKDVSGRLISEQKVFVEHVSLNI